MALTAVTMAVDALAAYRLTRLVTEDYLTADLREGWIAGAYENAGQELVEAGRVRPKGTLPPHDDNPPKLAVLVTCPWCVSMYAAAAVVAARTVAPRPWSYAARALATSAVTGLIAERVA